MRPASLPAPEGQMTPAVRRGGGCARTSGLFGWVRVMDLSRCILLQISAVTFSTCTGAVISTITAISPSSSNYSKTPANAGTGSIFLQTEVLPSEEYYEYLDIVQQNMTGLQAGVIPDPGLQDSPAGGDGADEDDGDGEEVALPDDSLADTDLHDHDLIDSVMYIYFGTAPRDEGTAGRQVLVVGSVITLIAQFMALTTAFKRVRCCPHDSATFIYLNTELALSSSNLVFMLGFQATANREWCEAISLLLHYLYLVTCCWLFIITAHVYRKLRKEKETRLHLHCALAWLLPSVFVLICYVANPMSYETRRYCWMSVQRGMLLPYMVPVTSLIVANTVYTVLGLQLTSRSESNKAASAGAGGGAANGKQDVLRKSVRVSAMLVPVFAVIWFMCVLAVENPSTLVLPLLTATANGLFNWFLCLRASVVLPEDDQGNQLQQEVKENFLGQDVQPLLAPEAYPILPEKLVITHGSREVLELRQDTISTITS